MDIRKEIEKIEKTPIGFDIVLAEEVAKMILNVINYLSCNLPEIGKGISKENAISALQEAYALPYVIGATKQSLKSNIDVEIAEKALPIAKLIYGKNRDLLPYLYTCMNNAIRDKEKHQQYMNEINEIESNEQCIRLGGDDLAL